MSVRQGAVILLLCLAIALSLSSCGPAPPKFGTPEWYWMAARERFSVGDFTKTEEHLEGIVATENPYSGRAGAWLLVVLGGMSRGYQDLADAYHQGGEVSQSAQFWRLESNMKRLFRMSTLGLAEKFGQFQKTMGNAEQYTLEFSFPRGSAAEPASIDRLRKGTLPPESERLNAEQATLERGVILETAAVVGAGEDAVKAAEMFKTQPVQVPRQVFLVGIAESLFEQSKIFDRKKLNEPEKRKILLLAALEGVKSAADTTDAVLKKKAMALQASIEKELKPLAKAQRPR